MTEILVSLRAVVSPSSVSVPAVYGNYAWSLCIENEIYRALSKNDSTFKNKMDR